MYLCLFIFIYLLLYFDTTVLKLINLIVVFIFQSAIYSYCQQVRLKHSIYLLSLPGFKEKTGVACDCWLL